ncbi:hypothetical protein D3C71_1163860 [compost metagenome]
MEDAHPAVERGRQDLEVVVETTKDKSVGGKAQLLAGKGAVSHLALRVIDLIAVRQIDNLLGKVGLGMRRNHHLVGDHVVHVVGPGGTRIAQVTGLDGCTSVRKTPQTRRLGKAHQVHGDVDAKLPRKPRDLHVGAFPHIVEMVKSRSQSLAHAVVHFRTDGKRKPLKPLAVMHLNQLCNQMRHGVIAKVCRVVADANFLAPSTAWNRTQGRRGRQISLYKKTRNFFMKGWLVEDGQGRERLQDRLLSPDVLLQLQHLFIQILPNTAMDLGGNDLALQHRQRSGQALGQIELLQSLVVPLHLPQKPAHEEPGLPLLGPKLDRAANVRQCAFQIPQLQLRLATVVVRLGGLRVEFQRPAKGSNRFCIPAQPQQSRTPVVVRLRYLGCGLDHLVHALQGFIKLLHLQVNAAQIETRLHIRRIYRQHLAVAFHGLRQPVQGLQDRSPVVMCEPQPGRKCNGLIERSQRFLVALQA